MLDGNGKFVGRTGIVSASSFKDRFWSKVERRTNECWPWQSTLNRGGYGVFSISGSMRLAHRIAYILTKGPIPGDLQIDHLCRNRKCVNPAHMEPVTCRVNVIRGIGPATVRARCAKLMATRTHCKHGHLWIPDNIGQNRGHQICLICTKAIGEKKRKKAAAARKAAGIKFPKKRIISARRLAGVCLTCGAPRDNKTLLCAVHRAFENKRAEARRKAKAGKH